jgi:hypothetical protein
MKFVRRTVDYTKWGHKINEGILTELKSKPVIDYIKHYEENWRSHVNGINAGKFQRVILRYCSRPIYPA